MRRKGQRFTRYQLKHRFDIVPHFKLLCSCLSSYDTVIWSLSALRSAYSTACHIKLQVWHSRFNENAEKYRWRPLFHLQVKWNNTRYIVREFSCVKPHSNKECALFWSSLSPCQINCHAKPHLMRFYPSQILRCPYTFERVVDRRDVEETEQTFYGMWRL